MEKEILIEYDLNFSEDENNIVKFYSNKFFERFTETFEEKFRQMFLDFERQDIYIEGYRTTDFYTLLEYLGTHHYLKTNQENAFVGLSQTILHLPVDLIQKSILKYNLCVCEYGDNPIITRVSPKKITIEKKLVGGKITRILEHKIYFSIYIEIDFEQDTTSMMIEFKKINKVKEAECKSGMGSYLGFL